ncbi:MAG: FAD-binding oxidoreductase, partial [Rhodospirillaceae bacterium]|nr:FAD-binding oxidoreductase [Rhodospirillaceae bacterium]
TACSWGNTGGIGITSIPPLSSPGVLRKVPRWLFDPLGPLALDWRHLPRLAPWLLRFVRAGRMEEVERITDALNALLSPCYEVWRPLFSAAGLDNLVHHTGVIHLYPDRAAFEADALQWKLRKDRGISFETLDRAALLRMEPDVGPASDFAVYEEVWRHVADPFLIVDGLARHFAAGGGAIRRAAVTGFETSDGRVSALRTEAGEIVADGFVIAAGAWSHRLSRMLGSPAPQESQRGYHVNLPDPGIEVRHIMMDTVGKHAITPMAMGLRLGGTSEFAGLDTPPNWRRARAIVENAKRIFPTLKTEGYSQWAGDRPLLPDSLPVIGPSPHRHNVYYAFGHSHIGLALGAVTGRLVADLVAGRTPGIDLHPFRIDRF